MSAELAAEMRTKWAIERYEKEMGIPVAGSTVLEQAFSELYKIYLIHSTLGEMKFRRELPTA
jgi:hypothetical protein